MSEFEHQLLELLRRHHRYLPSQQLVAFGRGTAFHDRSVRTAGGILERFVIVAVASKQDSVERRDLRLSELVRATTARD